MSLKFTASPTGKFSGPGFTARCALGKGGVVTASQKREGDGASPVGVWPVRNVFYRPDRVEPPVTSLPLVPLKPYDGWCDAANHPLYNRPVSLPFAASHEKLWRDDHVYDVIVELGYNDDPVEAGRGSAIFLHLARGGLAPTAGCVAVPWAAMISLLGHLSQASVIDIALN